MNESLPLNRTQAIELLKSINQEESNMNHYLESEAIMKKLAERFGMNVNYWGMLGLLHDVDWADTKDNWAEHTIKAEEILKEKGFDEDFIQIIQSHGYGYVEIPIHKEKERKEKVENSLAAAETLTGLIYAYALMRGGKISDMESKGLKKKFKDKSFAANCDREIILEIEKTGLELSEFLELAIDAMKGIKDEIGLN
mgnify:FL=1